MSRYESKKSKGYVPVLLIMVGILIVLFFIGNNQKKQVGQESEITSIDIPIEKSSAMIENKMPLNTIVEKEGAESIQETDGSFEITKDKPTLPDLQNSDADFKKSLKEVSTSLTDWFDIQQSIKKYIVLINDLSQNQIIYKHRSFLKISEKISVKEDDQGLYLAKQGYRRFDTLANAIDAINVEKGLELFLFFKPLFNQVFNEFAYPAEYRLEDIFLKAAASVIDAPVIEARLALVRDSVRYKYSDRKLESMNAVKKQMLRMGPDNTKKIQAKLRELVEAVVVYNE